MPAMPDYMVIVLESLFAGRQMKTVTTDITLVMIFSQIREFCHNRHLTWRPKYIVSHQKYSLPKGMSNIKIISPKFFFLIETDSVLCKVRTEAEQKFDELKKLNIMECKSYRLRGGHNKHDI
jgi:hypothetical protein